MPKDATKLSRGDAMFGEAAKLMPKPSPRSVRTTTSAITVKSATRKTKPARSSSPVQDPSEMQVQSLSTAPQLQTKAIIEAKLHNLENETMGTSWIRVLAPEFKKPYFYKLKEFLVAEHLSHTIFPSVDNIYSWSRLTSLDQVKVVILGQDPYHNVGQAHGLSFSVLPPTKLPGSLKNIYKQLSTDFPTFSTPKSGDLTPVAKLGVLWLNTSLTVRAHKAASHAKKGWEVFTGQVLRAVLQSKDEEDAGVVFMAWGLPAQKTCAKLNINKKKHLLLESAHPSPLSAHRGFIGNGHFKLANEWLRSNHGEGAEIDWTVLHEK